MNWEMFYLVCFVIGFVFSVLSTLGGGSHWHLPHFHFHGFHLHGPGHIVHGPAAHGPGTHAPGDHGGVSPFNASTLSAFLAWFGGVGFLLTKYSSVWALLALAVAFAAGIAGAAVVFWFLVKVMLKHDHTMDPSDYEMVGVLGQVSSPVREGGTGEMIFLRDGARCSAAVRSENGAPIVRGTEVVVTGFVRGIAYVRPWDEMTGPANPDRKAL